MSATSAIEWTEATWNPLTGCSKVSPGCAHCYAEALSLRFKRSVGPWTPANAAENVILHPERLDQPLRWKRPRMVFVNSMSDLFHELVPDEFILAVWAVMEAAPQHTFQILTKRPERMRNLLASAQAAPVSRGDVLYERREVFDYPGYEIDTDGVVWGKRLGRPMSPDVGEQGHRRVMLYRGGAAYRELVHRLVLVTFDRPAEDGEQGRHLDGDPANNHLSNLQWGTQAENWDDSKGHRTDRRYHKLDARQVADLRIAALGGESAAALGRRFGISDTQARNIIRGDQWGFKVLPQTWLGTSIENRRYVHRADLLRETPAAVRFISAEPLLGPLIAPESRRDGSTGESYGVWGDGANVDDVPELDLTGIDWLIVGGESGAGHRPMKREWATALMVECATECWQGEREGNTAFFMKQMGGHRPGNKLEDLPEELRVRAMPEVSR